MDYNYKSWVLAMHPEDAALIDDIPQSLVPGLYPEVIAWGYAGASIRRILKGFECDEKLRRVNKIWHFIAQTSLGSNDFNHSSNGVNIVRRWVERFHPEIYQTVCNEVSVVYAPTHNSDSSEWIAFEYVVTVALAATATASTEQPGTYIDAGQVEAQFHGEQILQKWNAFVKEVRVKCPSTFN